MKTQIWIAVWVYVLVAIVKKRLDLDASLYTLLQHQIRDRSVEKMRFLGLGLDLRETKTDATLYRNS